MNVMPSCKELSRLIASEELAGADWGRRLGVRFHLVMCRHCRGYVNQLGVIGKAACLHLGVEADPETLERLERVILKRPPTDR